MLLYTQVMAFPALLLESALVQMLSLRAFYMLSLYYFSAFLKMFAEAFWSELLTPMKRYIVVIPLASETVDASSQASGTRI